MEDMAHSGELSFSEQLLMALRESEEWSLWWIERRGDFMRITPGREPDFQRWENEHVSFRRYSRYRASWTKNDERKFSLIERTPVVSFFVRIVGGGELKIYPPRHLCV